MSVTVIQVCPDRDGNWWFSPFYQDPERPMKGDILTRTPEDVASDVRCLAIRVERVDVGSNFDYEVRVEILNKDLSQQLPRTELLNWLKRHNYTPWQRHNYPRLFGAPELANLERFRPPSTD